MKTVLILLLCLSLVSCQALEVVTGETQTNTPTDSPESTSIYQSFFQELSNKPLGDLFTPIFIDYKDLPGAFTLSVALVELTGDEWPEVLVAYTSDVPGAPAKTVTQVYQVQGTSLKPWGVKLPMTLQFFGLNQLFGTSEQVVGKQITRTYSGYQVIPELKQVSEASFRVVESDMMPSSKEGLDQLATVAQTMVVGTKIEDLLIGVQETTLPSVRIFNQTAYDQAKLSAVASTFDLRFINWKALDQDFLDNLSRYQENAGRAVISSMAQGEIDRLAARIDSDMQGGQVQVFSSGENRYFYLNELSVRGMKHFRLIKAQMGEDLIYFHANQPIKLIQGKTAHYPSEGSEQAKFLSIQQKMRSDISRHLLRQFLLLDAYDLAIPYVDYELLQEEE